MTRRRSCRRARRWCSRWRARRRALALETKLIELRVAGGSLFAALELRDMFPAKFQAVLEDGAAIHLRLQIELWEDRPVWDKLAQPGRRSPSSGWCSIRRRAQVKVADQYGEVSRQPAWQEPLALRHRSRAAPTALSDGARYYVRALATLGTIAEKESAPASNAVFGDDDSAVSIAAMGKMLFRAVLQVNEYLQSVSSEIALARDDRPRAQGRREASVSGRQRQGSPPMSPMPGRIFTDVLADADRLVLLLQAGTGSDIRRPCDRHGPR